MTCYITSDPFYTQQNLSQDPQELYFMVSPEKMTDLKHWDYSWDVTPVRYELNGCKVHAKADFQNNYFDQENETAKGRKLLARKISWQTLFMIM